MVHKKVIKKRSFIQVYNAKEVFPMSGKGWVVQRVKFPTMNTGSQIIWSKTFATKKQAEEFAKEYGD
jgi:hypothetical protein